MTNHKLNILNHAEKELIQIAAMAVKNLQLVNESMKAKIQEAKQMKDVLEQSCFFVTI
jgi:hypothetical protein